MELSGRKQKILASVVRSYVSCGEPVGSKLIADEIGVSSATVRNEMAELIDMGLLLQPHTSAGRIPSQRGYREYIDNFMQEEAVDPKAKVYFDTILAASAFDREKLVIRASEALAAVTKYMAAATTPSGREAVIKAVQFVQISRRTAMLILMSSAGTMKTKVFHCEFDLTVEIMRVFFRAFNERITGKAVSDITPAFIQNLAISFGDMAMLMSSALMALMDVAKDTMKTEAVISGQMNLLFYPEFTHGSVRRIIDVFEDNDNAVNMLSGRPDKPTVLLGDETKRHELYSSAVIIAPYLIAGRQAGALAAVGPMRMDYPGIIAEVKYLSERVGTMLSSMMREE